MTILPKFAHQIWKAGIEEERKLLDREKIVGMLDDKDWNVRRAALDILKELARPDLGTDD